MGLLGFRRTRAGRIVARLQERERTALRGLLNDLIELVAPPDGEADADPLARLVGIDPHARTPDDPALARLLPDGYGEEEPEAAADFRRFTERALREGKVAGARTVLESLERSGAKVVLSAGEAQAWLGTLNDLRLTLGIRLEVDEDPHVMDERISLLGRLVVDWDPAATDSDEAAQRARAAMETLAAYQLYDWLTFLQGTLIEAITGTADPTED